MTLAHPGHLYLPTRRLVLPGDSEFQWEDPREPRWEGRLSPEWWSRPMWRALFGDWPVPERGKITILGPSGALGIVHSWQVFQVPPNDTQALLYSVMGGCGGGGGGTGATGSQRQGGAGGAGASYGKGMYPLSLLPRILYSRAAPGGLAGAAAGAGGVNNFSSWCVYPGGAGGNPPNSDTIVNGGGVGVGGAAGGVGAGATTGGTGGTIGGSSGYWAIVSIATSGQAGVSGGGGGGGNGSAPSGHVLFASSPFHPGCGGGGATNADAGVAGATYTVPAETGWPAPASIVPGGNGSNGYESDWRSRGLSPMFATGGVGGAGHGTGVGGQGGQGAWGCGGAGGGGGVTGGRGGAGGDGFNAFITA